MRGPCHEWLMYHFSYDKLKLCALLDDFYLFITGGVYFKGEKNCFALYLGHEEGLFCNRSWESERSYE